MSDSIQYLLYHYSSKRHSPRVCYILTGRIRSIIRYTFTRFLLVFFRSKVLKSILKYLGVTFRRNPGKQRCWLCADGLDPYTVAHTWKAALQPVCNVWGASVTSERRRLILDAYSFFFFFWGGGSSTLRIQDGAKIRNVF